MLKHSDQTAKPEQVDPCGSLLKTLEKTTSFLTGSLSTMKKYILAEDCISTRSTYLFKHYDSHLRELESFNLEISTSLEDLTSKPDNKNYNSKKFNREKALSFNQVAYDYLTYLQRLFDFCSILQAHDIFSIQTCNILTMAAPLTKLILKNIANVPQSNKQSFSYNHTPLTATKTSINEQQVEISLLLFANSLREGQLEETLYYALHALDFAANHLAFFS